MREERVSVKEVSGHEALANNYLEETAGDGFIRKAGNLMTFTTEDLDYSILKMVTKIKAINGKIYVTDEKGNRRVISIETAIQRLQYFEIRLGISKEGSLLSEAFRTIYFMLHREIMIACDQLDDSSDTDCIMINNVLAGKHESGQDWSDFELDKHGLKFVEERRRNERIIDTFQSHAPLYPEITKSEMFGLVASYVDRIEDLDGDEVAIKEETTEFTILLNSMNTGLRQAREAGERTGITE